MRDGQHASRSRPVQSQEADGHRAALIADLPGVARCTTALAEFGTGPRDFDLLSKSR